MGIIERLNNFNITNSTITEIATKLINKAKQLNVICDVFTDLESTCAMVSCYSKELVYCVELIVEEDLTITYILEIPLAGEERDTHETTYIEGLTLEQAISKIEEFQDF